MSTTALEPRTRKRPISVIPRRCGAISGARLVDGELLARVNFSDHALERFRERAGLELHSRAALEPIVRDLLLQEGLRVPSSPRWARLRRPAPWEPVPLYLQAGFWMLFVGRPDPRSGPSYRTITTAITAAPDRTWTTALARGEIGTPPPPALERPTLEEVSLRSSVTAAIRADSSPLGWLAGIGATHRERKAAALRAHADAIADQERSEREYQAAREHAREKHLTRHGFLP
jgi:hypothetical protein